MYKAEVSSVHIEQAEMCQTGVYDSDWLITCVDWCA